MKTDVVGSRRDRNGETFPCALLWFQETNVSFLSAEDRIARQTLRALFEPEGFPPEDRAGEVCWRRDPLGKPFIVWQGQIGKWAERTGRDYRHVHVSNSHDGAVYLVLAAYHPHLVGIGVDLVYLPRLRRVGKDAAYLRRFARKFMSQAEWSDFLADSASDDEETLRQRVAAHFSLMEAASKACGTGLKIGAGMGRSASLPKQALGVRRLSPEVLLRFEDDALACLELLGTTQVEAHWQITEEFLVSQVLFWK